MREAAYKQIVDAMNITGFGIPEVKNKIKKLRSTYAQEMKKIQESKKSGAGVDNIYESIIQWLKELQLVYRDADVRKTLDNVSNFIL
jgi:selenocysteine-specific translation elongation factor